MAEFDYIIIGAGSSGGFLAYRLSEDPTLKILLLEAGLSDKHWTTTMPAGARYTFDGGPRTWSFATEPEPNMGNRVLDQPRGKVLGGSSSLNGMVFVRGHREDYDRWAADGAMTTFCHTLNQSKPVDAAQMRFEAVAARSKCSASPMITP